MTRQPMPPARCRATRNLLLLGMLSLLAAGCASFRAPSVQALEPAGTRAAAENAATGFVAVYEGQLRIWFFSWTAIWYVSVPPGGSNLSVAVLSPVGVKIMQMRGQHPGAQPVCDVVMPGAERLAGYGPALWTGMLWSLADDLMPSSAPWMRRGGILRSTVARGPLQTRYEADAATGDLLRKEIRHCGSELYSIGYSDQRRIAGRSCPGRIDIRCRQPRCGLTLRLKSLRWSDEHRGEQFNGS